MPEITLDDKKLYYSISEVAAMFGVKDSLLRYWETEFPQQIKPKKGARGIRSYRREDIEQLRIIYDLVKERGLKIAAAREILKRNKEGVPKPVEVVMRLKEIRAQLVEMKEALETM